MTEALVRCGRFTSFCLHILRDMWYPLLHPRATIVQTVRYAMGSLPIVLLIGLSLGLISWMHVGAILQRFDSSSLLPTLLMVAVVLEFGPVSVGLIAASRLASGLAAEVAAMKSSEQIDALRCLGVDPYRRLLVPRVLACVLVLPPLTILIDYAALLGSYGAEWLADGLSWQLYYRYSLDQIYLEEAVYSTAKTAIFGLMVGLSACWQGLRAEPSTEAVGSASTRAVVAGMLSVLLGNVILVRLIQLLS